jgi:hypothetical protein
MGGFKDEAMKSNRRIVGIWLSVSVAWLAGCSGSHPKPYGQEGQLYLPGTKRLVWAVAPTVNISGVSQVDPLLNSDLVYREMQQVHGLTMIPVDRVVEVYASLKIDKVESERQAYAVCDLLGCDGLIVPTITAYDPYDPPKLGASLQLFAKPATGAQVPRLDPHELERSPSPGNLQPMTPTRKLVQVVGLYDAADGSVLDSAKEYAKGRSDPNGPLGASEILMSMDRYCGFVYHELISQLLDELSSDNSTPASGGVAQAQ